MSSALLERVLWRLYRIPSGVAPTLHALTIDVSRRCLIIPVLLSAKLVYADVTGGVVQSGVADIQQQGSLTTVTQASHTVKLGWDTFNIEKGQTVRFVQPSSSALAINYIRGSNATSILGNLLANGQVWLINPNGIIFGQSAQVDVGALLGSTLNPVSTSGQQKVFEGSGTGVIVNQGAIRSANGGYVALIANKIRNQGEIHATQGTVALAAGSKVTLSFADNQLFKVNVDKSTLNALVDNRQYIEANGGTVILTAGAKQSLLKSVVNSSGSVEAQTLENRNGKIVLLAGNTAGVTNVSGTLDASAQTGNAGNIETSAAKVNISDSAHITSKAYNLDGGKGVSGTWLIDPTDFIIAANGGNISGSAIAAALQNNQNVTISTALNSTSCTNLGSCTSGSSGNGDIFVNDEIDWSTNTTLTLSAYRNILINRSISASGESGKLVLEYGQGATDGVIDGVVSSYHVAAKVNLHEGENFSTRLGSQGDTLIYQVITRLGNEGSVADGSLQGMLGQLNGRYVLGANIDASATRQWNYDAKENTYRGFTPIGNGNAAFAGVLDGLGHTIDGLYIQRHTVNDVYIGLFGATASAALIQNTGLLNASITGSYFTGGMVGFNLGTVNASFVSGSVAGDYAVGGLVGVNGGTVNNSYATGTVQGVNVVGGLVGSNVGYDLPAILYGESDVEVTYGTVSNSYASNTVSSSSACAWAELCAYLSSIGQFSGGLVAYNRDILSEDGGSGQISQSYWNAELGSPDNGLGQSLNADQMKLSSSYADWDLDSLAGTGKIWRIYDGYTTPLLRSFMQYAALPTVSYTFNGTEQNAAAALEGLDVSHVYGTPAFGTEVGTYDNGQYYSDQTGYDLAGGDLIISAIPAPPVVTPDATTPDLTTPLSNIQNLFVLPAVVLNNNIPVNQLNLNVQPASGSDADDDTLYDVIETYGCSA